MPNLTANLIEAERTSATHRGTPLHDNSQTGLHAGRTPRRAHVSFRDMDVTANELKLSDADADETGLPTDADATCGSATLAITALIAVAAVMLLAITLLL